MNTYKASCSIEAACWYLANAAMRAGDDPLADALREIIKELQAIDPDFHAGSRVRTAPMRQQPKILRAKKDRAETVRLLVELKKQNPSGTNSRLSALLFERGHVMRNGQAYSNQSV